MPLQCVAVLSSFQQPVSWQPLVLGAMCVAFPVKYKSPKIIIYTTHICVVTWMIFSGFSILAYNAAYLDSDEADNNTNHSQDAKPQDCYINFTAKQLIALLPVRLSLAVLFFPSTPPYLLLRLHQFNCVF